MHHDVRGLENKHIYVNWHLDYRLSQFPIFEPLFHAHYNNRPSVCFTYIWMEQPLEKQVQICLESTIVCRFCLPIRKNLKHFMGQVFLPCEHSPNQWALYIFVVQFITTFEQKLTMHPLALNTTITVIKTVIKNKLLTAELILQ